MAVGQKPGGYHFLSGKREIWQKAIDEEELKKFKDKFNSIEKNIKEVEKIISWDIDLNQRITVSDEFMKFFGLK